MTINRVSESSLEVLRQLIGQKIDTIWCPNLDAAGAHLAAWTLSMFLSKGHFLNWKCEWSETPKFLNDSWIISVSADAEPLNIKKRDDGAYLDVCTISIFNSQAIEKIEIFEYGFKPADEDPGEWVQYDQALVFRCADAKAFCICCMLNGPGIATYLHFSEDSKVIEEMTSESLIRLVLE